MVREEQIVEIIRDRLSPFRDVLKDLRKKLPIDVKFLLPEKLEELPGKNILVDGKGVLETLGQDIKKAVEEIEDALSRAEVGIETVGNRWGERKTAVEEDYNKILRSLQQSAVDGSEFIRLQEELEGLRPIEDQRILLEQSHKEKTEERNTLLTEWEEIKAMEFRLLDAAAKGVGRKLDRRVQVEVTAAGDREALAEMLRDGIGGRLSEAIKAFNENPDLSLPVLADSIRKGSEEIRRIYSMPQGQADSLAKAPPDLLMKLEELELPPTTVIRLNTASEEDLPSWQALDELSTGQKATAVLLLLLLESDAPLIVDQPEDDLDNRFIAEWVVRKMRIEKRRRQFVFSTHNANIPVLGDAELILGLSATGSGDDEEGITRIRPEHVGAIDSVSVRELVEEILEGGKTAFQIRRRKYGF